MTIAAWTLFGIVMYVLGLGVTLGLWGRLSSEVIENADAHDYAWLVCVFVWPIVLAVVLAALVARRFR